MVRQAFRANDCALGWKRPGHPDCLTAYESSTIEEENRVRLLCVFAACAVLAMPAFAQGTGCAGQPDGTPCDDGNACTVRDTCYYGYCTGGGVRNCNDGNPCTIDSCDPYRGCVHNVDPYCTSNRPPDCGHAASSRVELWPPHAEMLPVRVIGVTDPDGDAVTITVTGVVQDEPVDDGEEDITCPDAEVVLANSISLRAERRRDGYGRIYRISFTATDTSGNACSGTVESCVPLLNGQPCLDTGATFDPGECVEE